MSLDGMSAALSLKGTLTTALDLQTVSAPILTGRSLAWSNGTGAGQADKLWSDTRTVNASSSEDIDLAGVLTDAFGGALTFVKLCGLYVAANAGNTNNVVVGANVVNGMGTLFGPTGASGGTVTLRPGGFMFVGASDATAYAVTPGTGDLIHVSNSGAASSVTYDIVLIGRSA